MAPTQSAAAPIARVGVGARSPATIYRSCRTADIRGVIRAFTVLLALLVFPAAASAAGSGGTLAGPTARGFTATPATVAPGASVTFALRATPGALVRLDVIAPGQPAVRVRLGRVGRSGSVRGT